MNNSEWVSKLTNWFENNQRHLPWRSTRDPYLIWISEIMLQQTQVEAVIPYFDRFVSRFPTVHDLAEADLQVVLKVWEGMGYYSRARNLHKSAKIISTEFNGELPRHSHELRLLPGLGEYTAAAVASIAFGESVPAVDGNSLRVFTRFWGIKDDISQPKVRKALSNRLTPVIGFTNASTFNQSAMELGALICRPKNPGCSICPLSEHCTAYQLSVTDRIPVKAKKRSVPVRHLGVGVIWNRERSEVLIRRRGNDQMLGGLWEFPGGNMEGKNDARDSIVKDIKDKTLLDVKILRPYCSIKHSYTHFRIELTAFKCEAVSGIPASFAPDAVKWINLSEIDKIPFDRATLKVIEAVKRAEKV